MIFETFRGEIACVKKIDARSVFVIKPSRIPFLPNTMMDPIRFFFINLAQS